ncbi:PEP-CTERM sorting domain-containing protein [bacterium]|nr:PEP-CTERM sorting domain-containing protein [bacterium]
MKRFLLVVALIVCAVGFAGPASAVVLDDSYLIGTVIDGAPSSPTDEVGYANQLISMYNTGDPGPTVVGTETFALDVGGNVPAPPLDPVVLAGSLTSDPPTFPSTAGYDYLYAKFGGYGALFFIDGLSFDSISLTPPEGVQGGGLSHYALFNPGTTQVPEAGTLMLLGFGLAGVGTLRRFLKR